MHWKGLTLSAVAGVLLYAALMAGTDFGEAWDAAARLSWAGWLLLLGLSLANYVLRFLRWELYLRRLGHALPRGRHLLAYLGGFALTTTPAKAGEALRALYLKPYGVGYGHSIVALYAERLVDLLAIALLATALFLQPAAGYWWLAALSGGIAGALLLLQRPWVIRAATVAVERLPLERLRAAAGHGISGLRDAAVLLRSRLLAQGVLLGLVSWGAEAMGLYLVAQSLGLSLPLAAAVGIYASAMLAGALSFVPGGLGGTEAVMVSLLVLAGASPPMAAAITTIVRLATLWFAVVVGALALAAISLSERHGGSLVPCVRGADREP